MKEVQTQNLKQKPESGLRLNKHGAWLLDSGVKNLFGTNRGGERGDLLVSQAATSQLGDYTSVSRALQRPIRCLVSAQKRLTSALRIGFRKQCF